MDNSVVVSISSFDRAVFKLEILSGYYSCLVFCNLLRLVSYVMNLYSETSAAMLVALDRLAAFPKPR